MAIASTLSLGQAGFSLLPDPDTLKSGTPVDSLNVRKLSNSTAPVAQYFIGNKSAGPIENLGLEGGPGTSKTNVSFGSAVSGLEANLGDGSDTVVFTSSVFGSVIQTDATPTSLSGGADRFVATGGIQESSIFTGAGNDTLLFSKEVIDSFIDTGDGADSVTFNPGSTVFNTNIDLGAGNDVLTFQGLVFGDGATSYINAGAGSDTIVFGANSYVSGYSIDLGDGFGVALDTVQFMSGLAEADGIKISASAGDTLIIGAGDNAGAYTFDGSFFANGTDTLAWLS